MKYFESKFADCVSSGARCGQLCERACLRGFVGSQLCIQRNTEAQGQGQGESMSLLNMDAGMDREQMTHALGLKSKGHTSVSSAVCIHIEKHRPWTHP